jgi:hypothetical protein
LALIALTPSASHALLGSGSQPIQASPSQVNPDPQPAASAAQNQSTQIAPGPDAAQKRQIAQDSAALLTLATELKAQVDKANKDELSLAVIRKAREVETLAHNVRDELKTTLKTK